MTQGNVDARVARVVRLFESLAPDDLRWLGEYYAPDATFKDPFNEVRGVAAIQQIFGHMFDSLDGPQFVVQDVVSQDDDCFLTWDFRFRMRRFDRSLQTVRGATHLRFGTDGRIVVHRDYWDAAGELYEKLPIVGALLRWLKKRAAT